MKEIKSLKQEVNDLKEFTQNDLETKISDMEEKIFRFEIKMNEMYDYQIVLNDANNSFVRIARHVSQKQHTSRWSN